MNAVRYSAIALGLGLSACVAPATENSSTSEDDALVGWARMAVSTYDGALYASTSANAGDFKKVDIVPGTQAVEVAFPATGNQSPAAAQSLTRNVLTSGLPCWGAAGFTSKQAAGEPSRHRSQRPPGAMKFPLYALFEMSR